MQTSRVGLNKQSVIAVKWSAIGTGTQYMLQLGAQVVLARLLGPDNYGLFAIGLLVLTLCSLIADCGLAWGLVQAKEITNDAIRFTFTWQLITGGLATLLLFFFSAEVAAYFNEPRAERIIHWLSLVCVISAATTSATNLLRRKLDFKWINIVQVCSYAVGYIAIGIPMALYGGGALSLVAAWLAQSLCALVMTYARCRHSVRPLFWFPGAQSLTHIGATVVCTNLCNWVLTNLDRVIIARFLNAHAVGVYTAGCNLANIPNNFFLNALQPAFLAAGARLQDDIPRLKDAYLSVLACVWVLIAPLFMMFSALAPDLILTIYGDKWTDAGWILRTLALAMPAYISWAMATPVLWNTGKKHWEPLLQLPVIIVSGLLLYLYASAGSLAVATIAAFVFFMRAAIMTTAACSRVSIDFRDLAPYAWRGLLLCISSGGSVILASRGLENTWLPPILQAAAAGLVGFTLVASAARLFPNILGDRVWRVLTRFVPRLGRAVPVV